LLLVVVVVVVEELQLPFELFPRLSFALLLVV
jgi:hypothetical protein